jgi:uncharacterized protein (DUF488 family)
VSEREGSQRERGATTAGRPEAGGQDRWEERARREREGSQRERGATTVGWPERETVLLTFGHGTAGEDEIAGLLRGAGVDLVVDVRTAPGSRRHPQVARAELERWLPEVWIDYRWERDLGGFRKAARDSPDHFLRHAAFRGYAAHMRTPAFVAAVDRVLADAADRRTAVMCSEAPWWRCHRRMLADYVVLTRGVPVRHLMHDGRLVPHDPTKGVRRTAAGLLVYDAGQLPLDADPASPLTG